LALLAATILGGASAVLLFATLSGWSRHIVLGFVVACCTSSAKVVRRELGNAKQAGAFAVLLVLATTGFFGVLGFALIGAFVPPDN